MRVQARLEKYKMGYFTKAKLMGYKSDKELTIDEVAVRELLRDEEDATAGYIAAANKTSIPKLKKLLLDLAEEEKVHKGELIKYLKTIGRWDCKELESGEKEAGEILSEKKEEDKEVLGDARNVAGYMNAVANVGEEADETPKSSTIKEIIANWEKDGKIGDSEPKTREDALKQAIAIAYKK